MMLIFAVTAGAHMVKSWTLYSTAN